MSTKLSTYILLDRSGSMSSRWDESLTAIDAYVKTLIQPGIKTKVTLATFDTDDKGVAVEVIRKHVSPTDWTKITDIFPRGYTPLYDAIGKIIQFAKTDNNPKTVIVVLTDGAENASKEFNKQSAKKLLDEVKKNGWEVVFLGADFDAMGESAAVGISSAQTLNMTVGNYQDSLRSLGLKTVAYAAQGMNMSFDANDRHQATKPKGSLT